MRAPPYKFIILGVGHALPCLSSQYATRGKVRTSAAAAVDGKSERSGSRTRVAIEYGRFALNWRFGRRDREACYLTKYYLTKRSSWRVPVLILLTFRHVCANLVTDDGRLCVFRGEPRSSSVRHRVHEADFRRRRRSFSGRGAGTTARHSVGRSVSVLRRNDSHGTAGRRSATVSGSGRQRGRLPIGRLQGW